MVTETIAVLGKCRLAKVYRFLAELVDYAPVHNLNFACCLQKQERKKERGREVMGIHA